MKFPYIKLIMLTVCFNGNIYFKQNCNFFFFYIIKVIKNTFLATQ